MEERPKKIISPLERAMRLLSRRAYSERALLEKLCAAEVPFRDARDAVAECRKRGYLNDEQLAEDYVRSLAERGLGERRIRQALYKKGIPVALAGQPLEEAAGTEAERACEALEYKLRMLSNETDPRKKREKAFRFLVSRGFSIDSCRAALENLDKK